MTTDDHTFSTTSTTGTVDRRRRTFVIAAIVLLIVAIVATTLGLVLTRRNNNKSSTNQAEIGGGFPTAFSTGPPTPRPTPRPPTSQPSVSPSLSPTTPGASRVPSGSPSTSAPTTLAPTTTAPVTLAPVTKAPVTLKPTVPGETWMPSVSPVTQAPSDAPNTPAPTTKAPTPQPVTVAPDGSTASPVTPAPTPAPTPRPTRRPTTMSPTTMSPTTRAPIPAPIPAITNPPTPPPTRTPTLAPVMPPTNPPVTPAPTNFSPVLSIVEEVIRSIAIFGGSEFDDPTSYQSKALQWLQGQQAQRQLTRQFYIQRYALACVYYATYEVAHQYTELDLGPVALPWADETGWLTPTLECTWFGISCNDDGEVEAIELPANRLTGSFPREVTLLSSLQRLDLFDNFVWNEGNAGNAWLGDFTQLEYLYYGSTYFSYDGVPTQISKLSNLIEYDCSHTLYYGPIEDASFAGLDNLEYLAMGYNRYESALPSALVNLPSLEFLYVQDTDLTGSLDFVSDMNLLFEFWFDFNQITGTIPSDVPATLVSLSATNNLLTGTIPTTLGDLTLMKQLWLYNNNLTGDVPTQLGNLNALQTLFLYGNDLTGVMPSQVCDLPDLDTLVVDCQGLDCPCCTGCV